MTVGGGFAGVVVSIQFLIQSLDQRPLVLPIAAVFLLLYTYITVAGLLFVHEPNCTRPLLWALVLQVPWVSSSILVYKFAVGLVLLAGANYSQATGGLTLNYEWTLGSRSTVAIFQQSPVIVGINFGALVFLILLLKAIFVSRSFPQPINAPPNRTRIGS